MVKSIKNQTLPAKKNQRDKDAGICERENSFLFFTKIGKFMRRNLPISTIGATWRVVRGRPPPMRPEEGVWGLGRGGA